MLMKRDSITDVERRIGAAVRQWRIDQGYSQVELAERAGLSRAAIHRLETGAGTSMSTLIAALQALNALDALHVLTPRTEPSPLEVLAQHRAQAKQASRGPARVKRR